MNRIILFLPFITIMILVGLNLYKSNHIVEAELINKPIPDYEWVDIFKSEKVSASDYIDEYLKQSDVVMVNFFASWCGSCIMERKQLNTLANEYNIPIIGISYRDSKNDVEKLADKLGNPHKVVLYDIKGKAAAVWQSRGTSQSYIIDKNKKIRFHSEKPISAHDLDTLILPVIQQIRDQANSTATSNNGETT